MSMNKVTVTLYTADGQTIYIEYALSKNGKKAKGVARDQPDHCEHTENFEVKGPDNFEMSGNGHAWRAIEGNGDLDGLILALLQDSFNPTKSNTL